MLYKMNLKNLPQVALIVSIILCGCANSPEQAIVGKWRTDDGTTAQFFKDGTIVLRSPFKDAMTRTEREVELTGTYTFVDETHLKIDTRGETATFGSVVAKGSIGVAEVHISGDNFTMKREAGTTLKLQRVK